MYMYMNVPVTQATVTVNVNKKAEVSRMVAFSDGVWVSFKSDSTIRLFHTTSFNHMQDIDIAPPIRKVLCKCNGPFSNDTCSQAMR